MNKQMTVKQSIIFLILITIAVYVPMQIVHGQSNSDLYLEAKVNLPHKVGEQDLDITKFVIQGEKYKEICPSLQCKIDYKDKLIGFSPPDIPKSTLITAMVEFTLQDNITHADLGEKKKQLVEEYTMWLACDVVDFVIPLNAFAVYLPIYLDY